MLSCRYISSKNASSIVVGDGLRIWDYIVLSNLSNAVTSWAWVSNWQSLASRITVCTNKTILVPRAISAIVSLLENRSLIAAENSFRNRSTSLLHIVPIGATDKSSLSAAERICVCHTNASPSRHAIHIVRIVSSPWIDAICFSRSTKA